MRSVKEVAIVFALVAGEAAAQAPCTRAPTQAATSFFIERVPPAARDTLVVVRLCLSSRKQLGSYTAMLTYDTTRMRVATVKTPGGLQASNATVAGVIRIAGAEPSGFANGLLASVAFKPMTARALPRVTLSVSEANTTDGGSLLPATRVTGFPSAPASAVRPAIDSITPRTAEVSHERVTDLVLYGRGFAETGNTITFGGAEVSGLASERGGTIIRFLAPTQIPAHGSSGSHRTMPGPVEVRVRHAGGASNAVTFTVTGDS